MDAVLLWKWNKKRPSEDRGHAAPKVGDNAEHDSGTKEKAGLFGLMLMLLTAAGHGSDRL
jgi:hypothetical protein